MAYLDDVYVICAPENARYSYDLCAEVLEEFCGIKVNLGKLAAWSPTFSLPPPGIADLGVNVWKSNLPMHERGITIVGTPFGCQEYIDNVGLKKLGEEAKLISSVLKLPSIQVAWLLLYFCIVPKINHLLRTLSPASVENIASLHDNRALDTFRFLFCIPNEDAWDIRLQRIDLNSWTFQAKFPLRLGGCGLRDSVRISHAAYWASWADALPVIIARFPIISVRIMAYFCCVRLRFDIPCLKDAKRAGEFVSSFGRQEPPSWDLIAGGLRPSDGEDEPPGPGEWAHGWQFTASRVLDKYSFDLLLTRFGLPSTRRNASSPNKARLFSVRGAYAASWLTSCPFLGLECPITCLGVVLSIG